MKIMSNLNNNDLMIIVLFNIKLLSMIGGYKRINVT